MIHYYKNHIHNPITLPYSRLRWAIENCLCSYMCRRISHPVSEYPFRRKLISGKLLGLVAMVMRWASYWVSL
jgi:hypothetical protein